MEKELLSYLRTAHEYTKWLPQLGPILLTFKMTGFPFINSHRLYVYFSLNALTGSCNSFVVMVWGKSPHTF